MGARAWRVARNVGVAMAALFWATSVAGLLFFWDVSNRPTCTGAAECGAVVAGQSVAAIASLGAAIGAVFLALVFTVFAIVAHVRLRRAEGPVYG